MRLAPVYDLVCSRLVIPDETEESALTIQGKKSKIKRKDMDLLADFLGIPEKARFTRFAGQKQIIRTRIAESLLPLEQTETFGKLIFQRFQKLELE
ncbi:MAG: hypothetical protein HQL26_06060 [Candidatus Omnitrophica bacterium]|nr:hypothetical protein [Candidatus Omnitrophota bacterium]